MKQLLIALFVVTMTTGAHAYESTTDKRFALGYQSSWGDGGSTDGQWSVKYALSDAVVLQGLYGFNLTDASDTFRYTLGFRYLYNVIQNENSDFYTGLGVIYHGAGDAVNFDPDGVLSVNVPLGFAFTLANAPSVEFSAEMGLTFNYAIAAETWNLGSIGGGNGAVFTAGAHYYF